MQAVDSIHVYRKPYQVIDWSRAKKVYHIYYTWLSFFKNANQPLYCFMLLNTTYYFVMVSHIAQHSLNGNFVDTSSICLVNLTDTLE